MQQMLDNELVRSRLSILVDTSIAEGVHVAKEHEEITYPAVTIALTLTLPGKWRVACVSSHMCLLDFCNDAGTQVSSQQTLTFTPGPALRSHSPLPVAPDHRSLPQRRGVSIMPPDAYHFEVCPMHKCTVCFRYAAVRMPQIPSDPRELRSTAAFTNSVLFRTLSCCRAQSLYRSAESRYAALSESLDGAAAEGEKLAQRLAAAEEQYDTGLRKLTATAKQIATLQRQVRRDAVAWLPSFTCCISSSFGGPSLGLHCMPSPRNARP